MSTDVDGARLGLHTSGRLAVNLSDSQQAVVDYVVTPTERPEIEHPATGGWRVTTGGGGGLGASRSTVLVLKTRDFGRAELHAVAFSTGEGPSSRLFVRTVEDGNGGYEARPIGGGSAAAPRRDRPWVNFAAQWDPSSFRAGGSVVGDGAERASLVCMRFADGTTIEDAVDAATVLFEVDRAVTFPASVQIFDAAGVVLASYDDFDYLA
jgi:hypothetical protein